MRTRLYTVLALLCSLIMQSALLSCTKSEPDPEPVPPLKSLLQYFDLEYTTTQSNYQYLIPVAHNNIPESTVMNTVSGQGWKTVALYQLNLDKDVVKEFVLVTEGNEISSARNETFPYYMLFSDDGRQVSFFDFYGENQGRYETDYFEYDATVNSIVIPSWYCAYHRNGKLVFLSKDYLVCVCTHDKDYKQEEIIYLEIFQRVSKSERQTWVKRCPNYGIRI